MNKRRKPHPQIHRLLEECTLNISVLKIHGAEASEPCAHSLYQVQLSDPGQVSGPL